MKLNLKKKISNKEWILDIEVTLKIFGPSY
jgi:hypothetical protein